MDKVKKAAVVFVAAASISIAFFSFLAFSIYVSLEAASVFQPLGLGWGLLAVIATFFSIWVGVVAAFNGASK